MSEHSQVEDTGNHKTHSVGPHIGMNTKPHNAIIDITIFRKKLNMVFSSFTALSVKEIQNVTVNTIQILYK